jgi:hypothetical protein
LNSELKNGNSAQWMKKDKNFGISLLIIKTKCLPEPTIRFSPWIIVKSDNKKLARLESIKYVLSLFDYDGKQDAKTSILVDPNVVHRYFRMINQIDQ